MPQCVAYGIFNNTGAPNTFKSITFHLMGGVYSANGEVIVRRQKSDPSAAAATAVGKRKDWTPYSKSPHHTHHQGRSHEKCTRTNSTSVPPHHYYHHQHQNHQHHIRWSIGAADVVNLDPRRHHHRRQELIPRARLKHRPSQISTNLSEYRQSRMFVSSSLERIPQPAPIAKSRSFTQVNINGNTGGDCSNGRQQHSSHAAITSYPASSSTPSSESVTSEDKTPPSCSPDSPTTKINEADAVTNIPVPTTRNCSQVKPLPENHIEDGNDENTTKVQQQSEKVENVIEDKMEDTKMENAEECKNNGKGGEEEDVEGEEEEIRAQLLTKNTTTSTATTSPTLTTSSSTYSRYDIYRWRERPFGPSYRRKERQRRENELIEEKNNNNILHNNNNNSINKICAQQNHEVDDTLHPFINRFTSPLTYYEEEYSYEPEKEVSSMKTVLRTRSMVNLDGDDGKVLVRKTLSDANLDQDKNTNFRFNPETNGNHNATNNNIPTEKHHYFGYLDLQNHYHEKRHDMYQHFQQQTQQNNENHQDYNTIEEGTFRQRLRDLLVNNELVIQPRRNQPLDTPTNRRCFYHPVRINRELIDEELPDPDQVKLARDRFEKVLKIKGPDAPKGLQRTASVPPGQRITPEVRVPLSHSNTLPAKITPSLEKWTDTGSLSSGISSASEDVEDQLHEVSSEVLQKIRAYGTTVTYYGGKVIAQSHGPPSPLTSTIMEEIKFRLEVRDRLPFEEYPSSEEH